MSQIAFIGLGNMGGPMAQNLLKAGHHVTVFDLSPTAIKTLADAGATVAASAQQAVSHAEIVISMLPASRHVEALYLGESGLLAHIKQGTLVIDCSTIAAQTAIMVSKAATALGLSMLDAPVSGGTGGAISAQPRRNSATGVALLAGGRPCLGVRPCEFQRGLPDPAGAGGGPAGGHRATGLCGDERRLNRRRLSGRRAVGSLQPAGGARLRIRGADRG